MNLSQNAKIEIRQMLTTSKKAYALIRWRLQPLLCYVAAILTATPFLEAGSAESLFGLKRVLISRVCAVDPCESSLPAPLPLLFPICLFLELSSSVPPP